MVVPEALTKPVPFNCGCLPSNIFQSVEVKYPLTEVVAAGIDISGVVPPEDNIGEVAVTLVT